MTDIFIEKNNRYRWLKFSVAWSVFPITAMFIGGPKWVYLLSIPGLIFIFIGFIGFFRHRVNQSESLFSLVLAAGLYMVLIVIGLTLDSLFLKPLRHDALTMPNLNDRYDDPNGLFHLKGPRGWTVESKMAADGSGVLMRPATRDHYMGVSELAVFVKPLSANTIKNKSFLETMASAFAASRLPDTSKAYFQLRTEKTRLLNGSEGFWSILDIKRLWIPLTQISVYGIRKEKYLCSVTAIGLKNHSTLSRVLCLGVYETIQISE